MSAGMPVQTQRWQQTIAPPTRRLEPDQDPEHRDRGDQAAPTSVDALHEHDIDALTTPTTRVRLLDGEWMSSGRHRQDRVCQPDRRDDAAQRTTGRPTSAPAPRNVQPPAATPTTMARSSASPRRSSNDAAGCMSVPSHRRPARRRHQRSTGQKIMNNSDNTSRRTARTRRADECNSANTSLSSRAAVRTTVDFVAQLTSAPSPRTAASTLPCWASAAGSPHRLGLIPDLLGPRIPTARRGETRPLTAIKQRQCRRRCLQNL
jgi:hypothetical protein